MGCDIHLHIEIRVNGKWEHYGAPQVQRDYDLFALMAGVRNYSNSVPVAKPKGLPEDVSLLTEMHWKSSVDDWHTPSWLDEEEIRELRKRYQQLYVEPVSGSGHYLDYDLEFGVLGTYIFGSRLTDFKDFPDEHDMNYDAVRLVFWFDN